MNPSGFGAWLAAAGPFFFGFAIVVGSVVGILYTLCVARHAARERQATETYEPPTPINLNS